MEGPQLAVRRGGEQSIAHRRPLHRIGITAGGLEKVVHALPPLLQLEREASRGKADAELRLQRDGGGGGDCRREGQAVKPQLGFPATVAPATRPFVLVRIPRREAPLVARALALALRRYQPDQSEGCLHLQLQCAPAAPTVDGDRLLEPRD